MCEAARGPYPDIQLGAKEAAFAMTAVFPHPASPQITTSLLFEDARRFFSLHKNISLPIRHLTLF